MFDKARSRKWLVCQPARAPVTLLLHHLRGDGALNQIKGRVTEADIQVASVFMDRMNLHGESRIAAQNAFRIGKSDNYPLREKCGSSVASVSGVLI